MPTYRMRSTQTFVRGMRAAFRDPTAGQPEMEVIAEILANGTNLPPGRRLEKLYDSGGLPVYSVRVTDGKRLTFQINGNSVIFRAVGPHDDAYQQDRRL